MKAKMYCATVGTHYDGRSSELASALIEAVGSSKSITGDWKKIPELCVNAYELSLDQDVACPDESSGRTLLL
jgi:hypothetical protein